MEIKKDCDDCINWNDQDDCCFLGIERTKPVDCDDFCELEG